MKSLTFVACCLLFTTSSLASAENSPVRPALVQPQSLAPMETLNFSPRLSEADFFLRVAAAQTQKKPAPEPNPYLYLCGFWAGKACSPQGSFVLCEDPCESTDRCICERGLFWSCPTDCKPPLF